MDTQQLQKGIDAQLQNNAMLLCPVINKTWEIM